MNWIVLAVGILSSLVEMELALILGRNVMGELTVEINQMRMFVNVY